VFNLPRLLFAAIAYVTTRPCGPQHARGREDVNEEAHTVLKVVLGVVIPLASFATGLTAGHTDPLWLAKHPRLWLRSLLIILLVVPVGVVLLMEVLGTPDVVKAALTIAVISIGIGPPAAFKQARAHKEVVAYEVGLNLTLLALALVYLPLVLAVYGAIFHRTVELGVGQVAGVVLVKALIPLALGMLAGRLFPKLVAPIAKYAGILVQVVLLGIIVLALIATWRKLLGLGGATWLLCAGIVVGEIVVGHIAGRKDPETRGMLVAFSSMRFPALALLLASAAPRGREFIPVILAYVLCSFVLVTVYEVLTARRKRGEHAPIPVAPQRRAPVQGHA
jgi:predicted Na+-dependent transporter